MAYISFKPTDNFNTKLYTGNGSTQTISGVGFQPDMTWIKDRDATEAHTLFDSPRGVTKRLYVNSNAAESTSAISLTAWNSDGFALGAGGEVNTNNDKFVSWNWKGGTTSVPSGGSITPTAVTRNTTAGFYCAKYSGNGTDNATLAHGLGKKPNFMAVRKLNATYNFANMSTAWNDNGKILSWTIVNSLMTDDVFGNTAASSDYIYLNDNGYGNASGSTYVIYAWAEIPGYSKMTSYTGTGNADGPFVYCGFEPAFLMIKETDSSSGWCMYDNKRPDSNPGYWNVNSNFLQAQETGVESNNANLSLDFLSNGFKIRNSAGDTNGDGNSYMILAFANNPIVGTNETPGVAR